MIDNKTPALQMPLPHPSNLLGEDVERLAQALMMADVAFVSLSQAMEAADQALQAHGLDLSRHGHSAATPTTPGFMGVDDKKKLDAIAAGANNYSHPATHPPSIIEQNENARFFSDAERQKLAGIAASANNYSHPTNHPASVITQDANNRFVTDTEKASWNGRMAPGAFGLGGAALQVTDFNTVTASGFYRGSAATGAPNATGWWMVENIVHDANWMVQTAWGFAGNEGQVVTRVKSGGTWTNWSGNMAGGIKSVQRGTAAVGTSDSPGRNVTISAVNLSKAFVTTSFYNPNGRFVSAHVRLTTSTNLFIQAPQDVFGDGYMFHDVAWEVVEFF